MSPSDRPHGDAAAALGCNFNGLLGLAQPQTRGAPSPAGLGGDWLDDVFDESGRLLDGGEARSFLAAKQANLESVAASAASTNLPSSPRSSDGSGASAGEADVLEADTGFQRAVSAPTHMDAGVGTASAMVACKRPPSGTGAEAPARLALLVNGSDGDVRPLLALAKHLVADLGHDVHIFTNVNMVGLCRSHGVSATAVFADSCEVLERAGGLGGTVSTLESMRKPWKEAKLWAKEHPGACVPADKAMLEFMPHAVLLGTQALATAMVFEDRYGVPVLPVYLSRPYMEIDCMQQVAESEPPRPSFFAHSKFLDEAATGPKRLLHTGAWVLHEGDPPEAELDPPSHLDQLRAFLRNGPPPVAFGWGSMVVDATLQVESVLLLVLRSLEEIGRRGVVMGGWMRLHDRSKEILEKWSFSEEALLRSLACFAEREVCFVPQAPHEWLFPQCCCVVHHGGVGTVHAALRAGIPSVITPICADQFSFAAAASKLNVGIGLEALHRVAVHQLTSGLKWALGELVARSVAKLSQRMLREELNSVALAGSAIDGFVRKTVMTGKWRRALGKLRPQAAGRMLLPESPKAPAAGRRLAAGRVGGGPRAPWKAVAPIAALPQQRRRSVGEAGLAKAVAPASAAAPPQQEDAAAVDKDEAAAPALAPPPLQQQDAVAAEQAKAAAPASAAAPSLQQEEDTAAVGEAKECMTSEDWLMMPQQEEREPRREPRGDAAEARPPRPPQETEAQGLVLERQVFCGSGGEPPTEQQVKAEPDGFTLRQAYAMQLELWAGYASKGFQAELAEAETRIGSIDGARARLCSGVQKAVLPKYGFEGNARGAAQMLQAIRQHYCDKEFLMRTILVNNMLDLGPGGVLPPREVAPVMPELPESLRRSRGFSRFVRIRLLWSAAPREVRVPVCGDSTLRELQWFLTHSYGAQEWELKSLGWREISPDGLQLDDVFLEDAVPEILGVEAKEWPFAPVEIPSEAFMTMERLRELHYALLGAVSDGAITRKAQNSPYVEESYQQMKSRLARHAVMKVIPIFGFKASPAGLRMVTACFFVHAWHPEVISWLEEFELAVAQAIPVRRPEGAPLVAEKARQPQAQLRRSGA